MILKSTFIYLSKIFNFLGYKANEYAERRPLTIVKKIDEKRSIYKIDNYLLILDNTRLIDSQLIKTGVWEPELTDILKKYVKSGMRVFDVGANSGFHTILLGSLLGDTGEVHSFEPVTYYRKMLEENIKINNFTNIVVNDKGLSDSTQELEIKFSKDNASLHVLLASNHQIEKIQLIKFDDYIHDKKIDKIDLIKVDIEGHELFFLNGAIEALNKFKPVIIMEFSLSYIMRQNINPTDILTKLQDLGYTIYSERTFKPYLTKRECIDDIIKNPIGNIICMPNNDNFSWKDNY